MRRLVTSALVIGLLCAPPLAAQVPHLIRYQGQAVDSNGVPLEGPYTLTFRLYDAQMLGTQVWEEPHPNVPLEQGHFSVLLGQTVSLQTIDWTQPLWLGVQVNTDPELSPRQRITSVPLAITAEQLAVPVTTSTITDDANGLVPSGAIILWSGVSCPAGYSRMVALDGAMLKAGSAYAAPTASGTAELPAHTHAAGSYAGPSHVHNLWTDTAITWPNPGWGIIGSTYSAQWKSVLIQPSGDGPVTGASGSSGSATVATVLLCQKD